MKKYIIIAGNIGAGKSTLVELVSRKLNWKPYFEPVSENPYLEDFYGDMPRWAFHSQMYFLTDRLKTHKELQDYRGSVVQDRSVYEDAEIFVRNLRREGSLSERDFNTYWETYRVMSSFLQPPDLVVYMRASLPTLKERIDSRGRSFEADIPDGYLIHLNELYEDWIGRYDAAPKLILNADELNVLDRREDLDRVVSEIQGRLRGDQGVLW